MSETRLRGIVDRTEELIGHVTRTISLSGVIDRTLTLSGVITSAVAGIVRMLADANNDTLIDASGNTLADHG